MNRFRRRRFDLFFEHMGVSDGTRILDVGGLPWDWVELGFPGQVTCVSLSRVREGTYGAGNIQYIRCDASSLRERSIRYRVLQLPPGARRQGESSESGIRDTARG